MYLIINGKKMTFSENINLLELLSILNLTNSKIAIELNRLIISRSEYKNTKLINGDKLEIIKAIGGG